MFTGLLASSGFLSTGFGAGFAFLSDPTACFFSAPSEFASAYSFFNFFICCFVSFSGLIISILYYGLISAYLAISSIFFCTFLFVVVFEICNSSGLMVYASAFAGSSLFWSSFFLDFDLLFLFSTVFSDLFLVSTIVLSFRGTLLLLIPLFSSALIC